MATIARSDIRAHVIDPAIGHEFDTETIDRIEDEIFEIAPLSTWTYADLQYTSEAMDEETFWGIVERIAPLSGSESSDQDA